MSSIPHCGISLADLTRMLLRLGGTVHKRCGTGEVTLFHRVIGRPIQVNCRRKDAPRHAVAYVRRVIALFQIASYGSGQ